MTNHGVLGHGPIILHVLTFAHHWPHDFLSTGSVQHYVCAGSLFSLITAVFNALLVSYMHSAVDYFTFSPPVP